ncbi:MAG: EamA family transporter [Oscillospiraceae bacterium]|nr:EamA family transporter [Oscillospiraceae bacterium]
MKQKAILYIILAGILWGTSGVFVHYLAPYGFTPLQMTSVRALVSFFCILLYAFFRERTAFRIKPLHLLLFAGIGASLYFTSAFHYLSMQMTSVSTSIMLLYAAPIYVMVYSVLFLKEKLTLLKTVSVGCMLVGCCLVAGVIGGLKFDPLGMLLGVLGGVSYAIYNILTKIAMQKKITPITTTLYGFLFMSAISLFALEPAKLLSHACAAPAETFPLLLGLGICTFVIPYFLYTLAMRDLSAGTASALSVMEPMSATLFSVILLGESLDLFSVIGMLLILGSICMIGKAENDAAAKEQAA